VPIRTRHAPTIFRVAVLGTWRVAGEIGVVFDGANTVHLCVVETIVDCHFQDYESTVHKIILWSLATPLHDLIDHCGIGVCDRFPFVVTCVLPTMIVFLCQYANMHNCMSGR